MRTRWWTTQASAAGVLLCATVLTGCLGVPTPAAFPGTPPPAPVVPAAAAVGTAPESVVVEKVTDGDTLRVTGGRRIRVLGIDSCETDTEGGTRATVAAVAAVLGKPVVLTRETTVDRDRFGRELRYVSFAGGDLGELMVAGDHTAVYAGKNDASLAYVQRLRSLDVNGRTCGGPATPTSSAPVATSTATGDPDPDRRLVPDAPAVTRTSRPAASGGSGFSSCKEAKAAGAAPLYRGSPGYRGDLDGDGDGVACER